MKTFFASLSFVFCLEVFCLSQDVLCPAYSLQAGQKALRLCPKGKGSRLWLIVNPNSGPGAKRDAGFAKLMADARPLGAHVLLYLDLVGFPGDGLTPKTAKEHTKLPGELVNERALYSKWYGELLWDGWFFDDARPGNTDGFLCISNWPGVKVINAGSAFVPPPSLNRAIIVISEQAGAWPRKLTAWEQGHKSQCAVMGLKVSAALLPDFLNSTRGLAMRYASPLDDNWADGRTAYNTVSPYLAQLLDAQK